MTVDRSPRSLSSSGPAPLGRAVLALAVTVAAGSAASPAHAFWCEGSLVLVGDSMAGVRAACGEPASATVRIETTSFCSCCAGGHHHGPIYADPYGRGSLITTRTTQVDVWVYDFGYTRFMEQLEFEGGILRRMTRLGRGSRTRRDRVEPPAPPVEGGAPLWRRRGRY